MSILRNKYSGIKKPVRASLWFVICGFLQRGISILSTPVFTRLLTTEQYGIVNTFTAWLEILTVIVTLKLSAGVYSQGLIKYDEERDVFTSSLLGLATTLTLIWFLVYVVFRHVLNALLDTSTIIMVAMFGMIWASASFQFWSWKERVDYNYKKLVILTIAVSVAKPVLGIIAVVLSKTYKAEARILSLAVVELIAYSGLFFLLIKKGKVFFHKRYWKYALGFNLPLIPHYLSKIILNHFDRIMIKSMVGASASGIYSLAYNLSSMLTILNTSITNSLTPWIYKNIKTHDLKRIHDATNGILIIIALANLLLISIAPEAVAVFAPASYYEAIWTIPPVTMAVYFQFLYSLFANFEFYFEKTKWIMIASIAGAGLNIVLNYCFIPIYGYIAAAYTTLFCYFLYSFMHYIFMRKVCVKYCDGEQPYNYKEILIITSVFLFAGFFLMTMFPYWYVRYTILTIILILIIWKRKDLLGVLSVLQNK